MDVDTVEGATEEDAVAEALLKEVVLALADGVVTFVVVGTPLEDELEDEAVGTAELLGVLLADVLADILADVLEEILADVMAEILAEVLVDVLAEGMTAVDEVKAGIEMGIDNETGPVELLS